MHRKTIKASSNKSPRGNKNKRKHSSQKTKLKGKGDSFRIWRDEKNCREFYAKSNNTAGRKSPAHARPCPCPGVVRVLLCRVYRLSYHTNRLPASEWAGCHITPFSEFLYSFIPLYGLLQFLGLFFCVAIGIRLTNVSEHLSFFTLSHRSYGAAGQHHFSFPIPTMCANVTVCLSALRVYGCSRLKGTQRKHKSMLAEGPRRTTKRCQTEISGSERKKTHTPTPTPTDHLTNSWVDALKASSCKAFNCLRLRTMVCSCTYTFLCVPSSIFPALKIQLKSFRFDTIHFILGRSVHVPLIFGVYVASLLTLASCFSIL